MSTTYTTIWRLAVMTPGDPSVTGTWGATRNSGLSLYEQGAVGNTPISIAGQTAYTLTTANNASDQARLAMYNFTGALTGDCTVTMPSIARIGWATNSTTGGHNVILTTGSGTTLTLLPGLTYFWTCDGTNVASASLYGGAITASSLTVSGNASVGGTLGVTGNATFSATATAKSLVATDSANVGATLTCTAASGRSWGVFSNTDGSCSIYDITGAVARIQIDTVGYVNMVGGKSVTYTGAPGEYGNSGYALSQSSLTATIGLHVANSIAADGVFLATSDRRLKSDIQEVAPETGRAFIEAIRPVTYWKHASAALADKGHFEAGLVAQEVLAAGFGHMVSPLPDQAMPDGVRLGLDRDQAIPYLIAALKLAFAEIAFLKARLDD